MYGGGWRYVWNMSHRQGLRASNVYFKYRTVSHTAIGGVWALCRSLDAVNQLSSSIALKLGESFRKLPLYSWYQWS